MPGIGTQYEPPDQVGGSGDLLADGTVPLTSNWDVGSFTVTGLRFISDQATGTSPFAVSSTTVVTNLNADQVDGKDSTDLLLVDGSQALTAAWNVGRFDVTLSFISGSDPTNNTTGLDSRRLEMEMRAWDGSNPATRTASIRFEDVSGEDDQGRITFSSDDNGGSDADMIEFRRDTNIYIRPSSGNMVFERADGADVITIGTSVTQFGSQTIQFFNTVQIRDDILLQIGTTSGDFGIEWDTAQTNDHVIFGVDSTTNLMLITDVDKISTDYALATQSFPTLGFADGSATLTNVTLIGQQGLNFHMVNAVGGIITRSIAAGVTASTDSGQGDGPITTDIVQITTVGTAGDAVTLPAAVAGLTVTIENNASSNAADIFPATDDAIDGLTANLAQSLPAGEFVTFVALDATNWSTHAETSTGTGDLKADGTVPMTADWAFGGFDLTGLNDVLPATDLAQDLGSGALTWERCYIHFLYNSADQELAAFQCGETNWNRTGLDVDQRWEGDNDANLLTVDAGLESVGVGIVPNTHLAKFHVNGAILGQVDVEANTAVAAGPNIIIAAETRRVFTNEGITAKNFHTLPTAAAGLEYTFIVQDADGIRVVANTSDTIRLAGSVSVTAGYVDSTTIGSAIRLVAVNAVEWIATVLTGTWAVETS